MPFGKLFAGFKSREAALAEYPLETEQALNRLHSAAPVVLASLLLCLMLAWPMLRRGSMVRR